MGNPLPDQNLWERPKDMDTPRIVYKISKDRPSSDIAVETAAALAATSIVFRSSDPAYSQLVLGHAPCVS